ncbi:Lateral signaling target protein 2-like protein, partial [Bos mutus]
PQRSDPQLLAQFYHADEELSQVAAELDSLDGRKDPQRCTLLVSQFRSCQDNVLNIINQIMDACIPQDRAPRDFCVKFPEEIRHDNLAGQLWFGAECPHWGWLQMVGVAPGRLSLPPASVFTSAKWVPRAGAAVGAVRRSREALWTPGVCILESYVSAMVPVKSPREYYVQQEVIVLFCETVERALDFGYLTQDMIDDYEPALMFTIPRLAIVCGLVVYADGPLNLDRKVEDMSELFRPFHTLLRKIRDLLQTLTEEELHTLERNLCISQDVELTVRPAGPPGAPVALPHAAGQVTTGAAPCASETGAASGRCATFKQGALSHGRHSAFRAKRPGAARSVVCLSSSPRPLAGRAGLLGSRHRPAGSPGCRLRALAPPEGQVCPASLRSVAGGAPAPGLGAPGGPLGWTTELQQAGLWPHAPPWLCTGGRGWTLGSSPPGACRPSVLPCRRWSREGGACGPLVTRLPEPQFRHLQTGPTAVRPAPGAVSRCRYLAGSPGLARWPDCSVSQGLGARPGPAHPFVEGAGGPEETTSGVKRCRVSKSTVCSRSHPQTESQGLRLGDKTGSLGREGSRSSRGSQRSRVLASPAPPITPPCSGEALHTQRQMFPLPECVSQTHPHLTGEGTLRSQSGPLPLAPCTELPGASRLQASWCQAPVFPSPCSGSTAGPCSPDTSSPESARVAVREEMRSRFRGSRDLIHRLFVCISGVADQLQTNYASDLRSILKTLFQVMATKPETDDKEKLKKVTQTLRSAALEDCALCQETLSSSELAAKTRDGDLEDPPEWVPDEACGFCTACKAPFTVIRRKHHCRSCGKIFCSRCSSHSAPLPRYGQVKPVRVCTHCYMFHVTPFYSDKAGI